MHTTVWVITSKTRDEMEAAVRHKGVAGFTAGLLDEVDLTISRFSGENFQEQGDTAPQVRLQGGRRPVGGEHQPRHEQTVQHLQGSVGTAHGEPAPSGHIPAGIPGQRTHRRRETGNQESAPALARQRGPGPGHEAARDSKPQPMQSAGYPSRNQNTPGLSQRGPINTPTRKPGTITAGTTTARPRQSQPPTNPPPAP